MYAWLAFFTTPDRMPQVAEGAWVQRARMGLLAFVFSTLSLFFWLWPSWHLLEEQFRDVLTSYFVKDQPHPQILLVDFSDASIQALGGWPLNRARMADLVEELVGPLGAKVVGLDMLFPESGDPIGDARLASLAEHGPLVLSHVLDMQVRASPIRVGTPAHSVAPARLMTDQWGVTPSFGFVTNHAGLSRARCVGHVGVSLDSDGVMRRLAPLVQSPQGVLSTLSVAMLDCGLPGGAGLENQTSTTGETGVALPLSWRLPFTYGSRAFASVEAADVLAGTVDPSMTRGKFVLVGSSAVGLSDYVTTPLQNLTPGVLVHAEALAFLLDHGPPAPPFFGPWVELVAAFMVTLLVAVCWRRFQRVAWLLAVVFALAWPVGAVLAFGQGFYPWVLFPPVVVWVVLSFLAALEFKLLRDVKHRALVTLSQFVAAPVLRQLYDLGLTSTLQPKLQDITVLVVDMRDYTRLTTEMSLEGIADLTRDFLDLITRPVLQLEGTLDRYSGDGLIAFWGAPLPQTNHADLALTCAASLQSALSNWNIKRIAAGQEPIAMRIGIESGQALVGDLGNASRSVYTAVGACINTASRLQELGRQLGCDLVVGPQTQQRSSFSLSPLAVIEVKGLRSPLQVFTWVLS